MGTCILYNNASDRRVLNKNLTQIASYSIEYKGDIDVLQPKIVLAYDQNILASNYCFIQELGRYYYMGSPVLVRQMAIIQCEIDVLMTYRQQITNCECICDRSESKYNLYLNDGMYRGYQFDTVVTRVFPQGFDKSLQFILAVGG